MIKSSNDNYIASKSTRMKFENLEYDLKSYIFNEDCNFCIVMIEYNDINFICICFSPQKMGIVDYHYKFN